MAEKKGEQSTISDYYYYMDRWTKLLQHIQPRFYTVCNAVKETCCCEATFEDSAPCRQLFNMAEIVAST